MLTGRHPYGGGSPRELFQQLLTDAPKGLNEAVRGLRFPRALEQAVMKALARDPAKRQPTVETFAADVAKATQHLASDSPRKGLLGLLGSMIGKRTNA
jgi:hypothetical protein